MLRKQGFHRTIYSKAISKCNLHNELQNIAMYLIQITYNVLHIKNTLTRHTLFAHVKYCLRPINKFTNKNENECSD